MISENCPVIEQHQWCKDIFQITLSAPKIVQSANPGQFVHLRVGDNSMDTLLRRPFSIHRINMNEGHLELLYRVVGKGTRWLSSQVPVRPLNLMGPLGTGFSIFPHIKHAIIIAGGMGIAPVFFLIDRLIERDITIELIWGARSCEELIKQEFIKHPLVHVQFATEDGSAGHTGFVTSLIESTLQRLNPGEDTAGFTCGPEPMLKAVQQLICDTDFSWQVSLEEHMACGVGVCMGCAVRNKNNEYKMVCKHGPVMELKEINFEN